MSPSEDTIAAIASGVAPGAIGIVRVSGPSATQVCRGITGIQSPLPRRAERAVFLGPDGQPIDDGLVIFFPGPHSFTGEDVLELQGHGGPAVLQLVLSAVIALSAEGRPIRLARPGEFSERAFHAGKLDLLQAQGIADLIAAGSAQAARAAVRSLRGGFSEAVSRLQDLLTDLRVRVEACLDFPEEDIDFISRERVSERLLALRGQFEVVFAAAQRGAALAQGITIGIVGAPNVGKSSLLNALAQEELAIVTPVAGTTRDRIAAQVMIDGIPLSLVDTAGIRDATDAVEQMGIDRSWKTLAEADLVVWVVDATGAHMMEGHHLKSLSQHFQDRFAQTGVATPLLMLVNQMDRFEGTTPALEERSDWERLVMPETVRQDLIPISAKTGQGLDLLRMRLKQHAGWTDEAGDTAYSARGRQMDALARAQGCLRDAAVWLDQGALELLAEQLRLCQLALSELTGELHSDDLLGAIFSRFCIGK